MAKSHARPKTNAQIEPGQIMTFFIESCPKGRSIKVPVRWTISEDGKYLFRSFRNDKWGPTVEANEEQVAWIRRHESVYTEDDDKFTFDIPVQVG